MRRVDRGRISVGVIWPPPRRATECQALNHALQDRRLGRLDGLGRADMHPGAFEPQAVEPACLGRAIEQAIERECAVRRIGEQRRASGSRRPHRRTARPRARRGASAARPAPCRNRRARHSRCWSRSRRAAAACPCAPDRTARRAASGSASRPRSRACRNSCGRTARRRACGSAFTTPPPVSSSSPRSSEMTIFGRVRPFRCCSIGSAMWWTLTTASVDACIAEPVEHMIEQRLAGDLHQRLRQRVGERAHARAEARGEHHGAADRRAAIRGAGTCVSYQAFRSAIAGCIRARRR